MFAWFERQINPFPGNEPSEPPAKLWPFIWHYTRGIWPALAVMAALSAIGAVVEVWVFSFFGNLVDWLAGADKATFLEQEGDRLILMTIVVLVVSPLAVVLHNLVTHQTVFGNYPMVIRWMAHRYILGQSMSFYQDEYAGRVATKVMQAALGVRETVMKTADVFVYVSVYFFGALILVATFNVWLMLPFLVWFAGYVLTLRYFMPRLRRISERQADARSEMDRSGCGQLHKHHDGQTVCTLEAGNQLCARCHGGVSRHGSSADAACFKAQHCADTTQ